MTCRSPLSASSTRNTQEVPAHAGGQATGGPGTAHLVGTPRRCGIKMAQAFSSAKGYQHKRPRHRLSSLKQGDAVVTRFDVAVIHLDFDGVVLTAGWRDGDLGPVAGLFIPVDDGAA